MYILIVFSTGTKLAVILGYTLDSTYDLTLRKKICLLLINHID